MKPFSNSLLASAITMTNGESAFPYGSLRTVAEECIACGSQLLGFELWLVGTAIPEVPLGHTTQGLPIFGLIPQVGGGPPAVYSYDVEANDRPGFDRFLLIAEQVMNDQLIPEELRLHLYFNLAFE